MTKTCLLATAAAFAFISSAASAQDIKKNEASAPAPAMQQKAPAEKVAPDMHAGDRKLPETTGQAKPSDTEKNSAMDKSPAVSGENGPAKSSQSATEKSRATTGQGAAAGAAKLSTEQRTKITSVIRERKTPSVHLNVSVSVGTRIPATVHLYPLPVEVISIYPEWRGYDYVLVGNEIVVIDPRSHEIVAILEA